MFAAFIVSKLMHAITKQYLIKIIATRRHILRLNTKFDYGRTPPVYTVSETNEVHWFPRLNNTEFTTVIPYFYYKRIHSNDSNCLYQNNLTPKYGTDR